MAEGERTFLGLTHNPFVEPHRGFFERGGRKTHLEQLRHLSEWSRRILLVTGPEGVGKSTLYRQLAATLEPKVKAARINASLVNTGREVLSAVAQGFGIAVPADANTQTLAHDLVQHVESQAASDRLCLILVDDAHLLDNKAVDELVRLTHDSSMHLVMFGEVRMVPVVERAASGRGVGWQEIRLTGYGDADARDYLEWRFQQAKYRGRVPFTDHEVKNLVRLSEGLPGRMNQMANVLLVKLENGESAGSRGGFPRLHAALLALVVTVVGLLYVIVTDDDAPASGAPEAGPGGQQPTPAPAEEMAAEMTAGDPAQDDAEEAPTASADDARDSGAPDVPAPVAEIAGAVGPDGGEADGVAAAATAAEGSIPPLATEASAADSAGPVEVEASAVAENLQAAPATPVAEPAAEPAVASEEARPAEPLQPAADLPRDTSWLLAQNPAYFTLQLVTVSSLERAQAFVDRQREPGEFTIYQLRRDGRILHVILYGAFSSRDAAQAAVDRLPAEVGDVQPWIRQFEQVQAAARISTFQ